MVLLSYNFIVTCMSTCGVTRNLQWIPNTCLCGPCFSCGVEHTNLLCIICGIVRHGVPTCKTAMQAKRLLKYVFNNALLQE